jgi:hypothetical protein
LLHAQTTDGWHTPSSERLLLTGTAETQVSGMLTLTIGGDYYESLDLSSHIGEDSSARYTGILLSARYGLTPWLEASADLPVRSIEWDAASGGTRSAAGIDAPRLGLKAALPVHAGALSLAAGATVFLPSGNGLGVDDGEGNELQLTGQNATDWEVVAYATLDLTDRLPLRLHANAGYAVNGADDSGHRVFPRYYPAVREGGDSSDNDALILRAAVEFPGRNVDLFTEFRGDMVRDTRLVASKENPLTVSPGVRVRLPGGWAATGALSVSISGDDRETPGFDPHEAYPDWAATVSVSFGWPVLASDSDGDGIPDFRDRCPLAAEDLDGYRDDDGCPDPDNDDDGVPDAFDGTPLLMEDYDGYEDDDGVPDLDNDADGIVDERDMCPDDAEDLDGFEDDDGCPDQ